MYLLDTNALIILMYGDVAGGKLTEKSLKILRSPDKLYVCMVSFWEIAIKKKIGKLKIKTSVKKMIEHCHEKNIELIPIKASHLDKTLELQIFDDHRDPFDRLILSTALQEKMTLISTDARMRRAEYGADVIW